MYIYLKPRNPNNVECNIFPALTYSRECRYDNNGGSCGDVEQQFDTNTGILTLNQYYIRPMEFRIKAFYNSEQKSQTNKFVINIQTFSGCLAGTTTPSAMINLPCSEGLTLVPQIQQPVLNQYYTAQSGGQVSLNDFQWSDGLNNSICNRKILLQEGSLLTMSFASPRYSFTFNNIGAVLQPIQYTELPQLKDDQDDEISVQILDSLSFINFNQNLKKIVFTPSNSNVGTYQFRIQLKDDNIIPLKNMYNMEVKRIQPPIDNIFELRKFQIS
ncbi:UNKNOWN [Stylonychia lemnae]|uniref:Uncharacterized protein n=1 Tax=Stylonychia lemnae TaxID=5949 RepID=A0A078ANL1_STYLE|nr:UNKNOWN [Stylonychia lemnae]|eukprot:CDW83930.1 UNKNOWN [Stylonychia lemnae]